MSRQKSLIERIIETFLLAGSEIWFFVDNNDKIGIKINGEPCDFEVENYNVNVLAEILLLSMAKYLEAGIENSKRIDGGCTDAWHQLPEKEKSIDCPTCDEKTWPIL